MANSPTVGSRSLLQSPTVRQFLKYCIVGAGSTLLDFAIYLVLMEALHFPRLIGSLLLARPLAATISFSLSVTNGFVWNNAWTFRYSGSSSVHQRYLKFVVTNLIGLGLNLFILTLVARVVPASLAAPLSPFLKDPAGFIGKVAATLVVVFWNFTASKYWTFRN